MINKHINIIGGVNTLSYGIITTNILVELFKNKYNPSLFPIGQVNFEERHSQYIEKALENAKFYNTSCPTFRIWHQFDMSSHIGNGPFIGYTVFELDPLKSSETYHLNQLDHLCVPSEWAKGVCERSGVTIPISVIPLGIDRSIFNRSLYEDKPSEMFCSFISVGKLEKRKFSKELVEAFNKAFELKDRVRLLLAVDNIFLPQKYMEDFKKECGKTKMGSKIGFVGRLPSHQDIARMLCSCDIYVGCSHSEGFNMPQLEALSLGVPYVITTYNSAHTQYCNDKNSLLIEMDDMEIAHDGIFFDSSKLEGGQWSKWGVRQEEQLIEHMRRVYKEKMEQGNLPLNEEGIKTAKSMTWKHTTDKIIKILEN